MTIKKGDTVKLIAPFGLNEQGKAEYPDVNDLGKYGKVTGKKGEYFNVELFDGGAEYGVPENQLEKITFSIVDHTLQTVASGIESFEEAHTQVDALDKKMEGYWYVYGSDDTDNPWMGGGLAEFDPYGEEDDEEAYQSA